MHDALLMRRFQRVDDLPRDRQRLHVNALHGKQVLGGIKGDEVHIARPSARMIDEIMPHGSSRYSEEMPPVPPIPVLGRHQAHVDLVNQLGCLQRVALALALH